MNPDQITTIILNIIVSGGVATFLFNVIRGLKREIQNLNYIIENQNNALGIMERKRLAETEKVGNIYKSLIDELPVAIEKYNEIIRKTKDSFIEELERANHSKDEKLKQVAELRLKEIEVVQPIINQLSTLSDKLHQTMNDVTVQLRSLENISHMAPTLDLGTMWSRLKAHEESGLASHLSSILSGSTGKVPRSSQSRSIVTVAGVPEYEAMTASLTEKYGDGEDK